MESTPDEDEFAVLKLDYDRVVKERDRLRGARAFFARQLGPLPTFAGVSVSLVAAFSDKVTRDEWLVVALCAFGAMAVVSMLYSRMPAYRHLRAHREGCEDEAGAAASLPSYATPREWYEKELALERGICGRPHARNRMLLAPRWDPGEDLQGQLDRERAGVFVTQSLFLVMVVALVLAHL
jgi:hypothetical protein